MIIGYRTLVKNRLSDPNTSNAETEMMEQPSIDEPAIELPPEPEWRSYRVQKGDVLGSILPKFGLKTTEIRNAALESSI